MSSANSIRAEHLPVYSLGFAGVLAGYSPLVNAAATSAIPFPARLVLVQNYTDADIMVSYNGIDDHYPLKSGGVVIFDYCSDSATNVTGLFIPTNTIFYAKRLAGAPTSGSVYVSVVVGEDI